MYVFETSNLNEDLKLFYCFKQDEENQGFRLWALNKNLVRQLCEPSQVLSLGKK